MFKRYLIYVVYNNNILVVGTEDDAVYNKIVKSHGDLPVHKVKIKIINVNTQKNQVDFKLI